MTKTDQAWRGPAVNADDPDHLAVQSLVGGRDDDVQLRVRLGQRQGDGQTVSDLVNLIMIEQEADPRLAKPARLRQIRTIRLARTRLR